VLSTPRPPAWAHRPLDLGLSDLTTIRPCSMPCFFTLRGKVWSGGAYGLPRENRFGSQQAILGLSAVDYEEKEGTLGRTARA